MPRHSFRFEAIGTHFEIVTSKPLGAQAQKDVLEYVEEFDRQFSRFRNDSVVAQMSNSAGTYVFPDESERLFSFYESLEKLTDGKVNPLVGVSLEKLGYDALYSFKNNGQTKAPNYSESVQRKGVSLTTIEPLTFDFGAAGKGYLVDGLASVLEAHDIHEYLVDGSGDMLHKGSKPERVGLEDPRNPGKVIGEITLHNQALCASAPNRRIWGEGLHHIVDASTGAPTNAVFATWVLADSTMIADGLATALFFTDPDMLKARYNYEYLLVEPSGAIKFSRQFNGTLY